MFRNSIVRKMVVFTDQSPVLRQAADSLKLSSNIWLEDWVVTRGTRNWNLIVPDGINPTKVSVWKYFEVYNSDQLLDSVTKQPLKNEVNLRHTSMATKKPYGKSISKDMEGVAVEHNYGSKWWVSAGQTMGKLPKYEVRDPKERPHKFHIISQTNLFPLGKLKGTSVKLLEKLPISGSTRRYMMEDTEQSKELMACAEQRHFSSNLWFTEKQLELGRMNIREGEVPIDISTSSSFAQQNFTVYNIEQLENWEHILSAMGRYGTPEEPVFFFSGIKVANDDILNMQAERGFKQNYWVSGRDIEKNMWAFKDGEIERGVQMGSGLKNSYYNVVQLELPLEGFCKAGLLELAATSDVQ